MPDSLTKFKQEAKPSPSSQGGSSTSGVAPTNLDYGASAFTFTRNTSVGSIAPTVDGDVDSFSITPALPAGLSFDTTSGTIFGTPTVSSVLVNYTITATNAAGSVAEIISIIINTEPAPSALSYSASSFILVRNSPMVALAPTVTGQVDSYSVSPALPTGMTLDTTTGVISGTPTTFTAATNYLITATNVVGSTNVTLSFAVYTQPAGLRYATTPKVQITLDDASAFSVGDNISVEPLNGATLSGTVAQVLGNTLEVTVVSASMGAPVSPVLGLSRQVDDAATYAAGIASITSFEYGTSVQLTPSVTAPFPLHTAVSNNFGGLGQVIDTSATTILVGVLLGGFSATDDIDDAATYVASDAVVNSVNYVYDSGDLIDIRPTVAAGESISYAITPDLPDDFTTFSTTSGIIQGNQDGSQSLSYTITVSNPVGSVATSVSFGPFIAAPENLTIANERILTLNTNAKFYRGRPISSSGTGKGVVLKRFSDGKSILIRHQEGSFTKDDLVDDALIYGGGEAVIEKSVSSNLRVRVVNATGYENYLDSVATASSGGQGVIAHVDLANNDLYLKYLSGQFSDTSTTIASTLDIATLSENITQLESTTLRLNVTSGMVINTRFDTGFHVTSDALAAGLIHEIKGTGTTADIIIDVSKSGFDDGDGVDNYNPYVATEATINSIRYEHTLYLYTTEKAVITSSLPKGDNVTFSITPDLPAGLTLNTSTGIISGQPIEGTVLKSYILTATNYAAGLAQQTSHAFKMKVYEDFGVFNTLSNSNSTILHREGMGLNIQECRLTKDQIQNGKDFVRIVIAAGHPFNVGDTVSNQLGAYGTVEEIIQDPNITTHETLIVRLTTSNFSTGQNIDNVYPFVATAATIVTADRRSYNKDIACRLEVSENDLWALGAQFNLKAGKGMCDFITYRPYYYYRFPAHQTTTNTIITVETDNSEGVCGPADFINGAGPVDESLGFSCAGDWSTTEQNINCDAGSYTMRTINYAAVDVDPDPAIDDIQCQTTVEFSTADCGGRAAACISGGIRSFELFTEENPISSVQFETFLGANIERKLNAPQDQTDTYIRASNRILSNYVGNNSCSQNIGNPAAHEGRNYHYNIENWLKYTNNNISYATGATVSAPVSNSDTVPTSIDTTSMIRAGMSVTIGGTDYRVASVSAGNITLYAKVMSIANGAAITVNSYKNDPFALSRPYYEVLCLDPGADIIGRIYLQIREWDRFFSPEDDVDVLSQRLTNGTVATTAGSTTIATSGAADLDVFTLMNNFNDQRLVGIGRENHTVDVLDNFSASALDSLQTVDNARITAAAVSAWIRPLKQDSGDGIDGFGDDYNDYADWDDNNDVNHPAMFGCSVTRPDYTSISTIDSFTFPGYLE